MSGWPFYCKGHKSILASQMPNSVDLIILKESSIDTFYKVRRKQPCKKRINKQNRKIYPKTPHNQICHGKKYLNLFTYETKYEMYS
jgi:hypothetical protein